MKQCKLYFDYYADNIESNLEGNIIDNKIYLPLHILGEPSERTLRGMQKRNQPTNDDSVFFDMCISCNYFGGGYFGNDFTAPNYMRFVVGGKFGFADISTGDIKIPAKFDYAFPFFNGYALVGIGFTETVNEKYIFSCESPHKSGQYGVIDMYENEIIPLVYQDAEHCCREAYKEKFIVKKDGLWGIVDVDNKVLLDFAWDTLVPFRKTEYLCIKTSDEKRMQVRIDENFNILHEKITVYRIPSKNS